MYHDGEYPECFAAHAAVQHTGGVWSNLASCLHMVAGEYKGIRACGVGYRKVERLRAARVAVAVTLYAIGWKELNAQWPTRNGAFATLVHRARSLLAARSSEMVPIALGDDDTDWQAVTIAPDDNDADWDAVG